MGYFDNLSGWADDVGTLELADIGAPMRRRRGRRAPAGKRVNRRVLIPGTPGVPEPGLRLQPLGLGATAFTASTGTLQTLQASPQRPFKGQRLVVDITRTGTTSTGLVTIARLDVGTDNQLVGSGSISAGAFAATAFDVNLSLAPATPGINITLTLNISAAPSSSDRVDVGGTVFGTTVG